MFVEFLREGIHNLTIKLRKHQRVPSPRILCERGEVLDELEVTVNVKVSY